MKKKKKKKRKNRCPRKGRINEYVSNDRKYEKRSKEGRKENCTRSVEGWRGGGVEKWRKESADVAQQKQKREEENHVE